MKSIMDINMEVDTKYWRKETRVTEGSGEHEVSPMMVMKIKELTFKSFKLAIQSVEHYKFAMASLTSIIEKLESFDIEERGSMNEDTISRVEGCFSFTEPRHLQIGDSERSITKSKPNNSQQIHSEMGEGQNSAKKRTCSHCKNKGHYMSTCPEKKMTGEGQKPAKKRTCSHCKKKGHYMSTCPEKKVPTMMGDEVTVEDQAVLAKLSLMMGGPSPSYKRKHGCFNSLCCNIMETVPLCPTFPPHASSQSRGKKEEMRNKR